MCYYGSGVGHGDSAMGVEAVADNPKDMGEESDDTDDNDNRSDDDRSDPREDLDKETTSVY